MPKYLKVAASVLCAAACALIGGLWATSYWTAYFAKTPIGLYFSGVEGRCSVSNEFREYAMQGPTLTGYAVYRRGGWELQTDIVTGPMRMPEIGDARSKLYVPFWFPFLLTGSLAFVPWLRWRFGVRTLLTATAVWAVLLALLEMRD